MLANKKRDYSADEYAGNESKDKGKLPQFIDDFELIHKKASCLQCHSAGGISERKLLRVS